MQTHLSLMTYVITSHVHVSAKLKSFTEDNLLHSDGSIRHHGEIPGEDEELSPTLENFIVLRSGSTKLLGSHVKLKL